MSDRISIGDVLITSQSTGFIYSSFRVHSEIVTNCLYLVTDSYSSNLDSFKHHLAILSIYRTMKLAGFRRVQ